MMAGLEVCKHAVIDGDLIARGKIKSDETKRDTSIHSSASMTLGNVKSSTKNTAHGGDIVQRS